MKANKSETIFITGGLGFIGAYVCQRLIESGDRVVVYDLFKSFVSPLVSSSYPQYLEHRLKPLKEKIDVIQGDIRDGFRLKEVITQTRPDKIIHFAGLPIADISNQFPEEAISINFQGTANLLNAVVNQKKKIKKLINISSSMVYGDFKTIPCPEDHPTKPKGLYGVTKLGAEHLTRVFAERNGFPYITIRPSAVYGPTDSNRRVIQLFIENALKNKPIELHDGGTNKLDFTFVEDLAEGIVLATKNDSVKNKTFNMTRGQGRSLKAVANIVKSHFPQTKIISKPLDKSLRRPKRGAMDISKAKKLLGYNPQYSLEKGIKKYIQFLQSINH
jgi:nucleoside-diphosphate-sugar epimerase